MPSPSKTAVLAALRDRLAERMQELTASQKTVQEGAVHPEARQEDPKDTRAIEAGYLARGLAERVETLRDGIRRVDLMTVRDFGPDDAVASGALVTLADAAGRRTLCFLAPAGGGEVLAVEGSEVLVLTPRSPLGSAVAGSREGDEVAAELPTGFATVELEAVR